MSPESSSSATALVSSSLRRLRLAATLAHGLPGARLLIHDGDHVRAVARTQADIAPCTLRFAIREAVDAGCVDPVTSLLRLAADAPLECRLLLTDADVTDLDGGLYAIRSDGLLGVVFATLLPPDLARSTARDALRARGAGATPCTDGHRPLRVYQDRATDTTVLMGQVASGDPGATDFVAGAHIAAEACVIEELLAGV